MRNVSTNQEPSILDVMRELEAGKAIQAKPADKGLAASAAELDPAKLRESIKEKLEIVSAVEKTKYAHLIEGACKKTIGEIQTELRAALSELEELEKGMTL